ncbi:MAG: hypothetical protein OER88_11390 [Planctomycetota bacterium]|nr:hypothetical protein [Planctomycetota bacterium]
MKHKWVILFLLVGAGLPAAAQDDGGPEMTAGDALDLELCRRIRDQVLPLIEVHTRMKYRRPIPVRIEPLNVWKMKVKQKGFAGQSGKHALAYYRPGLNDITIVPWVIGRYTPDGKTKQRKTRQSWIADLEPTMIHELTHGIHHQNFFSEGRLYAASLRPKLSENDLDRSTVAFLLGEGVPELVALRTTKFLFRMHRTPRPLDGLRHYIGKYVPAGKDPYRMKLMENGYVDGLNLSAAIEKNSGMRGIRAVLYRPPPRHVLFDPEILATVDLEDPPDPDSVFGFLSPEVLRGGGIRLAVNPGHDRFFHGAYRTGRRVDGCLLGYVAELGDSDEPGGRSRYAFYVSDPDAPASWRKDQAVSLMAKNATGAKEKTVALPFSKGAKATMHIVKADGLWVRGEAGGMVVVAHETKPTQFLERRVLMALTVLHKNRPKKDLYKAAKAKALAKLAAD